ncbi:Fic family protein [soil metagenome]
MTIGEFEIQNKGYTAFIPSIFPPKEGFKFSAKLIQKANKATLLLGKLNGIVTLTPDLDFFLFTSLVNDVTIPQTARDEILHHFHVLDFALEQIANFPLSLKMIKALHKQLLHAAHTTHFSNPGKFRKDQNWINGTSYFNASYVPPPAEHVSRCLMDLIKFFRRKDGILPIIKAGIIFAQFETIHPFWDGNGRTGRLLLVLYLWSENLIECPIFFMAPFFKAKKQDCYRCLNQYRQNKLEPWLLYFIDIMMETTLHAIDKGKEMRKLQPNEADRENTDEYWLQRIKLQPF